MERTKAAQIANFRYQLISPIVCQSSLYFGETTELIRQAAKKIYQIPGSRKTRVNPRTIERYLKNYREGGYDALMPKNHMGTTRIPKEYLDLAISLKQENLKRPVTQIIETLELSGKVPKGLLKRSTLYDHFDCPSPGLLDTEIRDYNYLRRCTRTWEERGESSVRSLKGKRLH